MSTDAPRVSVVIPLFDKAGYVERAIASVLAQTESRFEVIVVDDGSTDGGGVVARRFRDDRVRLISQAHEGVSVARNRGIAEARAPWVGLLDADDEWSVEFLDQTLRAVELHDDVVGAFTNYLDSRTGRALLVREPPPGPVDDYCAFLVSNHCSGALLSATLLRRAALVACGGFPPGVPAGEDLDTLCRLSWMGPLCYVPRRLAVYRTGVPESATARQREEGPVFPQFVETVARWQGSGRLPSRFQASSDRLATRLLALHVTELLNRGRRAQALVLLDRRPELTRLGRRERALITSRLAMPPVLLRRLAEANRAVASQPGMESSLWVLASYSGSQLVRLLAHLALARLLVPEAFGVVALAGVVLQGLEMLTDLGTGAWLTRDERGDRQESIDTAFVAQAARGSLVLLVSIATSGGIALLYDAPDLRSLLPVTAVASFLTGLCSTSLHTALRHGNVRGPALVELTAQAVAAATMLGWASVSPTPWALVVGNVAWAGVRVVGSHRLRGEPHPRPRWDSESARSLFGFARWICVSSALYFLARQADRALLGGYLDLGRLGAYVLAMTIVDTVTTLNQRLSRQVLLPLLSRTRREDPGQLTPRFYAARRALDGVFLPAALGLALLARPVVGLLYGARYREVAWMLAVLSALCAMRCVSEPCEQLLVAIGATRTVAVAQAARALWLLTALPAGWAASAVLGVVWAVGLSEVPVLVVLWIGLGSRGALSLRHEATAVLALLACFVAAASFS